jgi:UDP-3-O-[3-hydroxymyristoyl] N-acetylglucosamine deacetylase
VETNQLTIKKKTILEGIGLHSGSATKIVLLPSEINSGISFLRTDIKNSSPILANWKNIVSANLCTKISNPNGESVSTIEHLMFSFYSLGITNLFIEINGPEIPIMDGSAKAFIDEILKSGLLAQDQKIKKIKILKTFEIRDHQKFIKYEPTNKDFLEIDYSLNYQDQCIKKQNFLLKNAQKNSLEVAHCRTFCHQEDLEKIFAMGLAKGGSLDNAIVISGNKILNQGGLRCKNEFVRHKVLDCLGDLYLSGYFINGKITCNQGGHELTANLIKKIFENKKNYLMDDSSVSTNSKITKKMSNTPRIHAVV